MQQVESKYLVYPERPTLLNAEEAVRQGEVNFLDDGAVLFCPKPGRGLEINKLIIPKARYFDLLLPTMYSFLEDLTPGSELGEKFLAEWDTFQKMIAESGSSGQIPYGIWAYYPGPQHLVHYAPEFWHRLGLMVRNSILYNDANFSLSWEAVRKKFENTIVAVAGCSVGNNATHSVVMDLRPRHIKVADVKTFSLSNANRVRLAYGDLAQNKAEVTARQLHAIDPFLNISVYGEGVHAHNVADFIGGNPTIGEPPASVVIEETDEPDMKILIRETARKYGVPVVMITDLGSTVQVDIRRFDRDKNMPLANGIEDGELYRKRDMWKSDLGNRKKFFDFAFSLIGEDALKITEFRRIVLQEISSGFGGIPQLGSTAAAGGGIAADVIARIILGYTQPERVYIDKAAFRIWTQ